MKENTKYSSTKTCLHERISMGNYAFQIFLKKFHLEKCKNLANKESRGIRNPAGFYCIIPQSRGIDKTRDLINCIHYRALINLDYHDFQVKSW